MCRWPPTARGGCCAMADNLRAIIAIEWLAAAQRLRFPCAAPPVRLEARARQTARRGAAAGRGPLFRAGYRGGDRAPARRRVAGMTTCRGSHEPVHVCAGQRAADPVSIPHAGTEIPEEFAGRLRLATGWRARMPTGICRNSTALRRRWTRRSSPPTISRTVIDVNRDPSGASLYPGQATTGLCPTETFDGEPLYRGCSAGRGGNRAAAREHLFRALSCGAYRGDRPAAARCMRASCCMTAIPSAAKFPRLFPGELPQFNIGTNDGKACDRRITAQVAAICAGTRLHLCRERPLQGRLDHAALRQPSRRRARHPDGTRLPRLYGRAARQRRRTGPTACQPCASPFCRL